MVHSPRAKAIQRSSTSFHAEQSRSANKSQQRKHDTYICKLCKRFHSIKNCPKFLNMTPKQRNIFILKEAYCVNSLARSHRFRDCRSGNMCRLCGKPHNSLLHPNYERVNRNRGDDRSRDNRRNTSS
ncbi:uncharacterized protein LOC142233900 [Haematobia irritans]|uniref:uncharacterized protein LOC142233900 n=1 Tax=Haematobia irritans TaxID=7368 RepID=UPI003F4F4D4D